MVLDASVVLAWLLREDSSAAAERMLARADLTAPSLLAVEVGHVLTKRVRGRTLSVEAAELGWTMFSVAPIRLIALETVADRALALSTSLHAVYYDCVYLALAVQRRDLLVTADQSFVRAARAAGLQDFVSAPGELI